MTYYNHLRWILTILNKMHIRGYMKLKILLTRRTKYQFIYITSINEDATALPCFTASND